jgi:hypothetical protein
MRKRHADKESGDVGLNLALIATILANLTIVKTRITLIIGSHGTPT